MRKAVGSANEKVSRKAHRGQARQDHGDAENGGAKVGHGSGGIVLLRAA